MSRENVESVRQPLSVGQRTRRGLDEQFVVRFPRATDRVARFVMRRPPRSRLRRVVLRRALEVGFGATNRRDYEPPLGLYDTDCECEFPPGFVALGDSGVRGRKARIEFQRRWAEQWGEINFELEEMIDLGDRVVVVGRIRGTGLSSGTPFESDWGTVFTVEGGLAMREQIFLDRAAALEAAGLGSDGEAEVP